MTFVVSITILVYSNLGITTTDLNTKTPTDLVNTLLGPGITVSNVTYTGANVAAGEFAGGTGIIGFESGIILSSGDIASVVGPNALDNTTTDNGTDGDLDLDSLLPEDQETFDAAVLEFDFEISGGDAVTFRYVFTSEEYNEYTNSPFNNVFGFFVNGVNYALLPDGLTVVSINNVNGGHPDTCIDGVDNDLDGLIDGADPDCTTPLDNIVGEDNSNSGFYINNDRDDPDGGPPRPPCPINIEADGLTVVLTLTAPVIPDEPNHIKLAIADAGDSILDSWVFIEAGSFTIATAQVDIDIKPFRSSNIIILRKWGITSVAILSTEDFDATNDMDMSSVTFGKTGDEDSLAYYHKWWHWDVNCDGYKDQMCYFWTNKTGFEIGDTEGILKGQKKDEEPIEGSDKVKIMNWGWCWWWW